MHGSTAKWNGGKSELISDLGKYGYRNILVLENVL